jgi:hypothetical protein
MPLLPILWSLAPGGLDVRGTTRCPSAAEVAERIQPLISEEGALPPTDWLELHDVPSQTSRAQDLEIRLARVGVDGLLGIRRLERNQSCAEIAEAVAVIAASWIGHYQTPAPQLPPFPEAAADSANEGPGVSTPVAAARPIVAAMAAGESSLARAEEAPLPGIDLRASASEVGPTPQRVGVGAGGGFVAGSSGGAAPALQILGQIAIGHWVFRLTGTATGTRDVPLGMGKAAWQRLQVLPSAARVWGQPRLYTELAVGPVVGLTRAEGRGFAGPPRDTGLALGIAPFVRVGSTVRRGAALWVGAGGSLWLRSHQVAIGVGPAGPATAVALPRWDLALAAGFTFFWDP